MSTVQQPNSLFKITLHYSSLYRANIGSFG